MSVEAEDLGYGHVEASKIETLAGYGLSSAEIARIMGIDEDTLTAHYAASIEHGQIKANARVAESLFRKATGEGREERPFTSFQLIQTSLWSLSRPSIAICSRRREYLSEPIRSRCGGSTSLTTRTFERICGECGNCCGGSTRAKICCASRTRSSPRPLVSRHERNREGWRSG